MFTDYPITALGDIEGQTAPIRECKVVDYDGDKYVRIEVGDLEHEIEIKRCYVYNVPGRCREVKQVSRFKLMKIRRFHKWKWREIRKKQRPRRTREEIEALSLPITVGQTLTPAIFQKVLDARQSEDEVWTQKDFDRATAESEELARIEWIDGDVDRREGG